MFNWIVDLFFQVFVSKVKATSNANPFAVNSSLFAELNPIAGI
jgi:hypothetical protein